MQHFGIPVFCMVACIVAVIQSLRAFRRATFCDYVVVAEVGEHTFGNKCSQNCYFGVFLVLLGALWAYLGHFFEICWCLGGVLGRIWASLGHVWDYGVAFGAYVGHSSLLGDPFLINFEARKIMKNLCFAYVKQ